MSAENAGLRGTVEISGSLLEIERQHHLCDIRQAMRWSPGRLREPELHAELEAAHRRAAVDQERIRVLEELAQYERDPRRMSLIRPGNGTVSANIGVQLRT